MQDKKPKNADGQRHGLCEIYFSNGQLGYKGLFIKGIRFGRHEAYWQSGNIQYISNCINGEPYGYSENKLLGKRYYAR